MTGLEPESDSYDTETAPVISIAISLKRLADVFEAMASERNEYGESPFAAIGAGIARSLRHGG